VTAVWAARMISLMRVRLVDHMVVRVHLKWHLVPHFLIAILDLHAIEVRSIVDFIDPLSKLTPGHRLLELLMAQGGLTIAHAVVPLLPRAAHHLLMPAIDGAHLRAERRLRLVFHLCGEFLIIDAFRGLHEVASGVMLQLGVILLLIVLR